MRDEATFRVKAGLAEMLKGGVIMDVVDAELLTPADEANHIDKWTFNVPFVCGATNLGEALRRIGEGAAMIRSKGEAGTGNVVEAVRHMRAIVGGIRRLTTLGTEALMMQLGADGVFVGSGIFKSGDPASRARAIVKATTHFRDPKVIAEASKGLGEAMVGREMGDLTEGERLAARGWERGGT